MCSPPLSQSSVLHSAVGGFQEEASISLFVSYDCLCGPAGLSLLFVCSFVPVDTKTCYWVMIAQTIEQHGWKLAKKNIQ